MTFAEAIQTCFRKYADFRGRATRSEYWWWVLFVVIVSLVAQVIGDVVAALVNLGLLLPSITTTARRLHDTGRSGWWQLIGLIPLVGWAVLIFWCVERSEGENAYG